MFENRVVRRIFGQKRFEVAGEGEQFAFGFVWL
jgi:hypothetical protein